jgi:Tol biopolymer transport system component
LEEFVKFHILVFLAIIVLFGNLLTVSAQIDSVLGQVSATNADSFAGGISGDGRFIVFESTGNHATDNPRNADGNREVFLFDYAQRRIFQITDTKSVLHDTAILPIFSNIRVEIVNIRPVISNDGRWIAFGSNATTSTPAAPNATNPGSFDGNAFTTGTGTSSTNPLTSDANTEMWMYQIPATAPADLSSGEELPVTNLSAGTFIRVTNTLPSRLPQPGSSTQLAVIADDNHDASINDNGDYIAFVSNRDLTPCAGTASATCGNAFPSFDNDEIYAYVRNASTLRQISATPRGTVSAPIYNANPTISGNGLRIAFVSKGNNAIVGMTGGTNADQNEEVYYADLDAGGNPSGTKKQVTATTRVNAGDVINLFSYGERMSRDGRYIAFDSYADFDATGNPGTNQTSFALYLFDTLNNTFRRIGPRSTADTAASGGDLLHYPGFTDNNANGTPTTLVLETRQNIKPDGTIPTTAADGLNPDPARQTQIYSYPINVAPNDATFTRLTKLPVPFFVLAATQPLTSDSIKRFSFNLAQTEPGTGNLDFSSEVYYLLTPDAVNTTAATLNFSTGASRIPVSASPVPTPSITPTPSPSPSASPTPVTPPAVQGLSPGMLAIMDYQSGINQPVVATEAVGSIERRFTLPIELRGVTMTINGAAVGLKRVSQRQIVFVVPPGLSVSGETNTASYPLVLNNNGTVIKGTVTIVPARPDVFTTSLTPGPGGRARIFNATNSPFVNSEPFNVTTIKRKGGRRVPTVLRVYLTGVNNININAFTVTVGNQTISGASILTPPTLVEPGVYYVDFALPAALNAAGDVPIVISVLVNGQTYTSRLQDTAPVFRIL